MSANCNADYMAACDVNDGEPCADCAAWLKASEAEARREWEAMSPEQRHPQRYGHTSREEAEKADLRDAGRGHLLP